MELNVQIKQAGKRADKIVTAKLLLKETPETVGELITYAVKATHAEHSKKVRQIEAFEKGDLSEVILYTQEEIEDKAVSGRIDFGFLKSTAQVTKKQEHWMENQ